MFFTEAKNTRDLVKPREVELVAIRHQEGSDQTAIAILEKEFFKLLL